MTPTKRITRAEYDVAKAAFIAALRVLMEGKNLTPAAVAAASKARMFEEKTTTAISPANVYHYLSGISVPTPKKLAELAAVLDCSPSRLLPKTLQGRRSVTRPLDAGLDKSPNAYRVQVLPGSNPNIGKLLIEAVMPIEKAYAWAKVLGRKLNEQQVQLDHGMTPIEVAWHNGELGTEKPPEVQAAEDARMAVEMGRPPATTKD